MPQVIFKLSLITKTIGVIEDPLAMPNIILPTAFIFELVFATANRKFIIVIYIS